MNPSKPGILHKSGRPYRISVAFVLAALLSCGEHKLSEWYYIPEVYEQKFGHSSIVINKYSTSSMYNDSYLSGFALTKNETSFSLDQKQDLAMNFVVPPFNSDTVTVIRLVEAKEKFVLHHAALDTHYLERSGGVIKVIEKDFVRRWSVGPCTYEVYGFHKFTESNDSITFTGLIPKWKSLPYQEGQSITLPKGNIYLSETNDGKFLSVLVDVLLETRYDVRVNKYGTNELDRILPDNLVRCSKRYKFSPSSEITLEDFSNEGVFRKVDQ